jgi:hypothetical protein
MARKWSLIQFRQEWKDNIYDRGGHSQLRGKNSQFSKHGLHLERSVL